MGVGLFIRGGVMSKEVGGYTERIMRSEIWLKVIL